MKTGNPSSGGSPLLPRLERWRRYLKAFMESTGLSLGKPPEMYATSCEDELHAVISLHPSARYWLHPAPSPSVEYGLPCAGLNDWPERSKAIKDVFDSEAFKDAVYSLPPGGWPTYKDRCKAWKLWARLQEAARIVEADRATCWFVPSEVQRAIKTVTAWTMPPNPKGDSHRPTEPIVTATKAIVRELSRIRDGDDRPLSAVDTTRLLVLAAPDRFIDWPERSLRELVEEARPSELKRSMKRPAPAFRK